MSFAECVKRDPQCAETPNCYFCGPETPLGSTKFTKDKNGQYSKKGVCVWDKQLCNAPALDVKMTNSTRNKRNSPFETYIHWMDENVNNIPGRIWDWEKLGNKLGNVQFPVEERIKFDKNNTGRGTAGI
jgi:hypothetical protein